MKKIGKFLLYIIKSVLIGLLIIFVINVVGSYINISVPVNVISILIVGFLRIPGLAMMLVYNLLI